MITGYNQKLKEQKSLLKEAQDAGDGEQVANATEKLSRASAEAENLRRLSAQQQIREKNQPQEVPVEPYQPTYNLRLRVQTQKQRNGRLEMNGLEMTKQ